MIGFIDTLFTPLGTTGNYKSYNAIADLHILQFAITHTLMSSVCTSRILQRIYNSLTVTAAHIKYSNHTLSLLFTARLSFPLNRTNNSDASIPQFNSSAPKLMSWQAGVSKLSWLKEVKVKLRLTVNLSWCWAPSGAHEQILVPIWQLLSYPYEVTQTIFFILFITPRHGPHRKLLYFCVNSPRKRVYAVVPYQRLYASHPVSWQFLRCWLRALPNNGCFSGSTILTLSKYATVIVWDSS
jgi:hypothetical protein